MEVTYIELIERVLEENNLTYNDVKEINLICKSEHTTQHIKLIHHSVVDTYRLRSILSFLKTEPLLSLKGAITTTIESTPLNFEIL